MPKQPNYLFPSLVVLTLLALLSRITPVLDQGIHDRIQRRGATDTQNSPVVLVMIDDQSIQELLPQFGPPPWARSAYLKLFQTIDSQKPKAIVFDGYFGDWNQAQDKAFFQQLQQIPNLIVGESPINNDTANQTGATNNPNESGSGLDKAIKTGIVTLPEDSDGLIRHLKPTGSLASEATLLSGSRQPYSNSNTLIFWKKEAFKSVGSSSFYASHPVISASQLLSTPTQSDGQNPKPLQHKIVVVGNASTYFRDYHPTPMSPRHLGSDIQATIIDQMLENKPVQTLPDYLTLALGVLMLGLGMQLRIRLHTLSQLILYGAGGMITYAGLAHLIYNQSQWLLPVSFPLSCLALGIFSANTLIANYSQHQAALLQDHLKKLVSKDVFHTIKQRRGLLKPEGDHLTLTVMFVDIRNSTTLAEKLAPKEMGGILNEFYKSVSDIALAHHGTIDKFLGDGILILFGAPLPSHEHAEQALSCAQALLNSSPTIGVQFGVSIHTGSAYVGFVGPPNRLEYTAVGDTVNLCIRLQEENKRYETPLIITEPVLLALPDASTLSTQFKQQFEALGGIPIRGRSQSIPIFKPASGFSSSLSQG